MTFHTKYGPGDEVWVMEHNKPQKCIIDKVEVGASRGFKYLPQYTVDLNTSRLSEDRLFKTKQELIESL